MSEAVQKLSELADYLRDNARGETDFECAHIIERYEASLFDTDEAEPGASGNVMQLRSGLYRAKAFRAITLPGDFEASGTLCGHLDFVLPGGPTITLDPHEAQAVAQMLMHARKDVLENSDPYGDPRLVDRSPTPALELSGGNEGLRTSGAALGDKSAHIALLRDALEPFADLSDGSQSGLCQVLLESADLHRALRAMILTAAPASPESLSVSQEDPILLELSRLRSVEQQYLVLIRQSCGDGERAAPTEAEPSGWLIELWDHKTGIFAAQWWSLGLPDDEDGRGWTKDSLQALRFARERDAQAYIDETGWTEAKPTEHAWGMK